MSSNTPLDTRTRILDAAERLLGRYGYKKLTVDDIAVEAGVGRRTVYVHFGGKDEVLLASMERVIQRVLGGLRDAAERDGPAPEKLRAMLHARVLIRFDSVRAYRQGLPSMFEGLRAAYLENRQRLFDAEAAIFEETIAAGVAAGELADVAPHDAAWTLIWMTNSLLLFALGPDELEDRAWVETRVGKIAQLALAGLLPRS